MDSGRSLDGIGRWASRAGTRTKSSSTPTDRCGKLPAVRRDAVGECGLRGGENGKVEVWHRKFGEMETGLEIPDQGRVMGLLAMRITSRSCSWSAELLVAPQSKATKAARIKTADSMMSQ